MTDKTLVKPLPLTTDIETWRSRDRKPPSYYVARDVERRDKEGGDATFVVPMADFYGFDEEAGLHGYRYQETRVMLLGDSDMVVALEARLVKSIANERVSKCNRWIRLWTTAIVVVFFTVMIIGGMIEHKPKI